MKLSKKKYLAICVGSLVGGIAVGALIGNALTMRYQLNLITNDLDAVSKTQYNLLRTLSDKGIIHNLRIGI